MPLGFANFSFGHADDGSKYFGFGWYADFDVAGFGMNTLVTEDAQGNFKSRMGATVGFDIPGTNVGVRVGVTPGGGKLGGTCAGGEGLRRIGGGGGGG